MLEIFAERRLIGEIKQIGDLLHILARKTQKAFRLHDNKIVDPAGCRPPRDLLDKKRQIFGRYAQFVGVKRHGPFLGEMHMHQFHEIMDIGIAARALSGGTLRSTYTLVMELHKLIDDRSNQICRYVAFKLMIDLGPTVKISS